MADEPLIENPQQNGPNVIEQKLRNTLERLNFLPREDKGEEATGPISDYLFFPTEIQSFTDPFVIFSAYRPAYNQNGLIDKVPASGVCLYLPMGHSINDSITYNNNAELGIAGEIIQRLINEPDGTTQTFDDLLGRGARRAAVAAGEAAIPGGVDIRSVLTRETGVAPNQKAYAVFTGVGMRTFQFAFRLVPSNQQESDMITNIVKFFRYHSYPSVNQTGLEYTIPDSFRVVVTNGEGRVATSIHESFVKLPEVVCTNVSVTYNKTSMSYFQSKNAPVEVDLSLTFIELQPITRELVQEGF